MTCVMAKETKGSSTLSSERARVKAKSFCSWRYSHYFQIVEVGDKNLRARCTLYVPGKKPLSEALNTTSNFKKHLENFHKTINLITKEPSSDASKATAIESRKRRNSDDVEDPNPLKRLRMLYSSSSVSPVRLQSLISEYIIEDMLPLSTVESQPFRRLIGGLSSTQVLDRKILTLHLDKAFKTMAEEG